MEDQANALNKKYGVLYVDDEQHNLKSFTANFRHDFKVFTAISAKEGRKILDEEEIAVVITDQRMPIVSGIEFLESVLKLYPDVIRSLLTGYADMALVTAAINTGLVYKYMVKPWQDEEISMFIQNAFELYYLRKENKELAKKLEQANIQIEYLKSKI